MQEQHFYGAIFVKLWRVMVLLKKYYESIIHDKQRKIDANNEYSIFISQTQRKQKSRREKTTHV